MRGPAVLDPERDREGGDWPRRQIQCWPKAEFGAPNNFVTPIVGNLELSTSQEAALVAYMKALTDEHELARP